MAPGDFGPERVDWGETWSGRGEAEVHCPRAGPGRVEAFFAGPDPGPQGRANSSLALAPGRLDPGPGPGQG